MFPAILVFINIFILGAMAATPKKEKKPGDDDHDDFIPCC
jgi:hypothetical protein